MRTGSPRLLMIAFLLLMAALPLGCDSSQNKNKGAGEGEYIRVTGSNTMEHLAMAWAEKYMKAHPQVKIVVSGGGSGVGITALTNGKIDICSASREMKPEEKEALKEHTKKEAVEHRVGLDCLAIYVNKDNPIASLSIPELADIYGEKGQTTNWNQLGVKLAGDDKIVRITRPNTSGTYEYFKEATVGSKGELKADALEMDASQTIVNTVGKTPGAIAYSGMGFKTDDVKFVPVSKEKGQPGVLPSLESATDATYPIARPLFLYTAGEPSGAVKDFIAWTTSDEGQRVVQEEGYVPLPKSDGGK